MVRITVEIDEAAFHAAQEVLGTDTKVATINAALRDVARRKQVADAIAAMNSVEMDYTGSENSFRYGGGRDLTKLDERARAYAQELERLRQEAEVGQQSA